MKDELLVLLHGEVVGRLLQREVGFEPTFEYTEKYAIDGSVALSASLPLQSTPFDGKKVQPFLMGLLPDDEDVRSQIARRVPTHRDDSFALLAEVGKDCPGAVQFCRAEELSAVESEKAELNPLSDADIADRIRALTIDRASWTLTGEHWSLGGQQEKFVLQRSDDTWNQALGSSPTTHIFKPGIPRLKFQALVEHVSMQAAHMVGADVAKTEFMKFEDQWAIVVSRFDRTYFNGRIVRIHQEDFVQACGRLPNRKYEADGGPGVRDITRIVSRESTDVQEDLIAIADFFIMNLVAGAPDGHAKNLSMIRAPGLTRVAPLYDFATGLTYESQEVDRSIAISIGGERLAERISRSRWQRFSREVGIPYESVVARVASLADAYPLAFEAACSALPPETDGATEVAERTIPTLKAHTKTILNQI